MISRMFSSSKLDDRPFKGPHCNTFGWLTLKRKLLKSGRLSQRRKECKSLFDLKGQQGLHAQSVSRPKKKKKACCQNHEVHVNIPSLTQNDGLSVSLENGTLRKKPCSHSHHSTCHRVNRPEEECQDSKPNVSIKNVDKCDHPDELEEDEGWFSREASETSEQVSCEVMMPYFFKNTQ